MNTLTFGAAALLAFALRSGDSELDQGLQSIEHRLVQTHSKAESLHITNKQQWHGFWRRFTLSLPPPKVNFQAKDLLIVLMGNQPSGGYVVAIGPLESTPNQLQVSVLFCRPDARIAQVAEVTSPYAIRFVDKVEGQLKWIYRDGITGRGECR